MQRIRCRNFLVPRISLSLYFTFSSFFFATFLCDFVATFRKQIFHYDLTLRCLIASRDFMLMRKLNKDIYRVYIYFVCIYLTSQSHAAKFCNWLAGSLGD